MAESLRSRLQAAASTVADAAEQAARVGASALEQAQELGAFAAEHAAEQAQAVRARAADRVAAIEVSELAASAADAAGRLAERATRVGVQAAAAALGRVPVQAAQEGACSVADGGAQCMAPPPATSGEPAGELRAPLLRRGYSEQAVALTWPPPPRGGDARCAAVRPPGLALRCCWKECLP